MSCNCDKQIISPDECLDRWSIGCSVPYYTREQIDEIISGISVSGVTEEELQEAIDEVKTEIEAEIPVVPTDVSAFNNDVPYLSEGNMHVENGVLFFV